MEAPDFWEDVAGSQSVTKELKNLKDTMEQFSGLQSKYEDIETLIEMAEEENDAGLLPEIENEFNAFKESFETLRIETLLSGEFDGNNAVINIHALSLIHI